MTLVKIGLDFIYLYVWSLNTVEFSRDINSYAHIFTPFLPPFLTPPLPPPSLTHLPIHSLPNVLIHSPIHPLPPSLPYPRTHSLPPSLMYSFTYLFTASTHSLCHLLTHLPSTHFLIWASSGCEKGIDCSTTASTESSNSDDIVTVLNFSKTSHVDEQTDRQTDTILNWGYLHIKGNATLSKTMGYLLY